MQVSSTSGKVALTPQFEAVLTNIYEQVDLDGNGTLSRTEFNLFNWRTSGEEVQDDEWQVVKENFGMKNGELTLEGFLQLHQGRTEFAHVILHDHAFFCCFQILRII